jgi:haloalkane dehalogenase
MPTKEISADFPFVSKFIEIHGSKIHYIDEGSGDPILFLHGNPTSSYLWRNIIPYLTSSGRCIAPDLIGMGKSDKPDINYGFFDHVKYIDEFIRKLELKNITFVIHDWGSALGFYYGMRNRQNIKALAFMEAIIMPVPSWDQFPEMSRSVFQGFRTPDVGWKMIGEKHMFVERMLPGAIVRKLTEEEMNYYRNPYTEVDSRKPLWRWPNEIPIEGEPADVKKVVDEYNQWLQETELPKILFYTKTGFLISPQLVQWCETHLKKLTIVDIGPSMHFLQEDNPHKIGSELAIWYRKL